MVTAMSGRREGRPPPGGTREGGLGRREPPWDLLLLLLPAGPRAPVLARAPLRGPARGHGIARRGRALAGCQHGPGVRASGPARSVRDGKPAARAIKGP